MSLASVKSRLVLPVQAHPGSPRQRAVISVCVCVCVCVRACVRVCVCVCVHYIPGRQGRRSVDAVSWHIPSSHTSIFLAKQGIAPGAARRYAPADGSSTVAYRFPAIRPSWIQKSRRIYVHPRTGPQSTHLWWPAVAKLQAASVPMAYAAASCSQRAYSLGSCAVGQTDGQIALFQNPP